MRLRDSRPSELGARGLVVGVALVLLAGCGSGQRVTPGTTESGRPSQPSATVTAPIRPTVEQLSQVGPSRDPVSQVAATIPLTGLATGVAMDPVTGKAFVVTCPGCGQVPPDDAQVIEVIDIAKRARIDTISIPGRYTQIAADPYAGVLYVSHTGERGEQIRTIDTTSYEVTGTIDLQAWGITVDPTSGTVYALEASPAKEKPTRVAVIDPRDGQVLRRIDVGVDSSSSLTLDPVRGLLLVSDHSAGRVLVVDPVAGTLARAIQVVGWLADPCENCLGEIGTPVVDLTSGLAYVSGSPDLATGDPEPSQGKAAGAPTAVPAGLAPTAVPAGLAPTAVPTGLAPTAARIVPAGVGTSALYVLDPTAGSVTQTRGIPAASGSHAIDPAAGTVYLSVMGMPRTGTITTGVLPVATGSLTLDDEIPVPAGSAGRLLLAVDPPTGQVWAAGDGSITVLE